MENITQATINKAVTLKSSLQETAVVLSKAKELIAATTYDNLRNKHNTIWETFMNFYNNMYSYTDTNAQMLIMDINEELKNIQFKLKNAIGIAETKDEKSKAKAKQIVEESKREIERMKTREEIPLIPIKKSGFGLMAAIIGIPAIVGYFLLKKK